MSEGKLHLFYILFHCLWEQSDERQGPVNILCYKLGSMIFLVVLAWLNVMFPPSCWFTAYVCTITSVWPSTVYHLNICSLDFCQLYCDVPRYIFGPVSTLNIRKNIAVDFSKTLFTQWVNHPTLLYNWMEV